LNACVHRFFTPDQVPAEPGQQCEGFFSGIPAHATFILVGYDVQYVLLRGPEVSIAADRLRRQLGTRLPADDDVEAVFDAPLSVALCQRKHTVTAAQEATRSIES